MIQLFKGDCLEVMKLIPDGSVDAIITDPPYGTTACKWDTVIPFDLMWEQLNRIIKPNGAIVLFGSEPFSSALRMSNIKDYKYDWIWEKSKATGFALCNNRPLKAHEMVHIFSKSKECYYPQKTDGTPYKSKLGKKESNEMSTGTTRYNNKDGKRYPRSVQYFKTSETERNGFDHPTQKPIELMEYLIKTYTNPQETVLDFTMGSGSTGVAAVNTGRKFIGIEMNDKYFEIAEQRINENNLF